MAQTHEFYTEQADASARRAKEATLEKVKERELRSERSWRKLAEHARATMIQRQTDDAARAKRREAAAAQAAAAKASTAEASSSVADDGARSTRETAEG